MATDKALVFFDFQNTQERFSPDLTGRMQAFSQQVNRVLRNVVTGPYEMISILSTHSADDPAKFEFPAETKIWSLNGNRAEQWPAIQAQTLQRLRQQRYWQFVHITDDPRTLELVREAACYTHVKVVTADVHTIEEVLPDLRQRVVVLVDFENIYFTLTKKYPGIQVEEIVRVIQQAAREHGKVADIVFYADWSDISNAAGFDVQRFLADRQMRTQYQVSRHGKSSSDMMLVDDARTYVEQDRADLLVLVTCDRDYRSIILTARQRGVRVSVLGVDGQISRDLLLAADEVWRIEDWYTPPAPVVTQDDRQEREQLALLLLRVELWRRAKRWGSFIYLKRFNHHFGESSQEATALERAISAGYLNAVQVEDQTQIHFNKDQPLVTALLHLVDWLPMRVRWLAEENNGNPMAFISSEFLARGMSMGKAVESLHAALDFLPAETLLSLAGQVGLICQDQAGGWKISA